MSFRLHLVFLWHMHQPFYYDWEKGWLSLPWVRLHAVKAYYDMPKLIEKFPGAKGNFNLVPSLLKQILFYQQGGQDYFLYLSRKPATALEPEEKEFILRYFFSAHWDTMINPYPRYHQLLEKRGQNPKIDLSEVASKFSPQEMRDLQVWFNLTWVGFSHRDHPLIAELLAKGRNFSEEEKNSLLDFHLEILKEIIPLYRKLQEEGRIELSATPFFHPILPLLIDTDLARRNLPQAPLPPRFAHPEDARFQIQAALDYHQQIFDKRPQGIWPSEGSVCPEIVPLAAEAGVKWMATDEEILYRSLNQAGAQVLLKPYLVEINGAQVTFIFRHHELSDRIGFVYRNLSPQEAVRDLLQTARQLAQESGEKEPLLALILDGENPWEYYRDGGEGFLEALYQELSRSQDVYLTTISEYLESHPPQGSLSDLYTGSWINANFDIWIGHEEENRAWELLGRTREYLGRLEEAPREAQEAMLAAEGSDWFWWYGDHFTSLFDLEFDRLFRNHLIHVFRVLGKEPLADLAEPIKRPRPVEPLEYPTAFIQPVIDGRETFFYEWIGAGKYEPDTLGEAMYLGQSFFERLYFGFDLEHFYLRLDLQEKILEHLPEETEIRVFLFGEKHAVQVNFKLDRDQIEESLTLILGAQTHRGSAAGKIAFEHLIELALPFALLGFHVGEKVSFYLEVVEKGLPRERFPRAGNLVFTVPDENFEEVMWQV